MRCPQDRSYSQTKVYTLGSFSLGVYYAPSAAYSSHYASARVLCVIPGTPDGARDLPDHIYSVDWPPSDEHWIIQQSSTTAPFFSHQIPSLSALPFSTTSINYPLLRAWCEHCDTRHSTCASARKVKHRSDKQRVGPAVRCIDCHTRKIVEIATSDRFFALSYVWGEQLYPGSGCTSGARETASIRGARQLPDVIPKVIEDAMVVVANLGERYLWVDQYCIDQNDEDDKHAQIGNMAAIYQGAYATIVAFSATDSASGLPGVRNLARKPCPSVVHPKLPLSALQPSAISSAQLATSSVWITRGWTFQEAILSRRLLIFTDYQVEFICSNAVWHECTLPGTEYLRLEESMRVDAFLGGGKVPNSFRGLIPTQRSAGKIPMDIGLLTSYLEEYSGRHLTYQSDALNAISGLLSRISTLTYLGIPILDQFDLVKGLPHTSILKRALWCFLGRLAWYPAHQGKIPLQRRYAFPSWSWLGWEGRITFPELKIYDQGNRESSAWWRKSRILTSVWIANQVPHTKGETLVPLTHLLKELPLGNEHTSIVPHLTNYLWVEGPVIKMAFCKGFVSVRISSGFVPKSFHPPIRVKPWKTRTSFRNCSSDRPSQGTVYQRIMTEQWDCLWLIAADYGYSSFDAYFLILDQVPRDENTEAEDCYYAVGSVMLDIRCEDGDHPWDDPKLRRRIKLC
ncbi:HET-domain-containing protein [Neurospora crassa]|nr:HET-domain-containing protein [Neurospora crassa]